MNEASSRYRIVEKIGVGGMAEVYRGEMETLEGFRKSVAIKRILPSLTKNRQFVTMFLDEARLTLKLGHANVVQVFDIGQSDATYFLVMEHVDGPNLRQFLDTLQRRRRKLPPALAVLIGAELCKGLAYAHDFVDPESKQALKIVHRDVSPPNVLLSRTGEVKITDFGLAKAVIHVGDTEPGIVKGKFSYLSPEAAMGATVDQRSDIFSCGSLLFEMLTGRRLFHGDTDWQTIELVRQAEVPPIRQINHDVPEELEHTVRKALARDPNHRYTHAADLAEALTQQLFTQGWKVTHRDLARLVDEALLDTGELVPQPNQITRAIVEDEIRHFASLEQQETKAPAAKGQQVEAPVPQETTETHLPRWMMVLCVLIVAAIAVWLSRR